MCTYVYEFSLYKTPPSWLQWSLVTVLTPLAVSRSKVLVFCVLNVFYRNGSLWFLKVCYLLCITRRYSNGWRQWRFRCIISLVVDIADYMVSEMRVLALPLLPRLRLNRDGIRWRTGKLANVVGSQSPSHYLGTWLSSITTADAHTSAASSRLNWRPCRFKWTRPFRRKTKSGFCACAITFQTQSNHVPDYTASHLIRLPSECLFI